MSFRSDTSLNPVDLKRILASMEILVDTREQRTDRARRRYESFGIPYRRATLSYGDYTYNAMIAPDKPLFDAEQTVHPLCAVERKMDLDELAECFTRSRDRFRAEFERAQECGCKMHIVIEDANWENLMSGRYRSRFNEKAFLASITAWAVRYDAGIWMCKAETSGKLIKEILYRDLKERLERGDFG